jgi:PPOX class probable F420-dependent enzyme
VVPKKPPPERMAHADERLRGEVILWLTTVRRDGQAQSSPVWFLWDGRTLLIYSLPTSQKVPNIRANPRVSVHLNDDGVGGDIVSIEGSATIDQGEPPLNEVPEYVDKYRQLIADLGTDPDRFADAYSVAIRVTPTRWRVTD